MLRTLSLMLLFALHSACRPSSNESEIAAVEAITPDCYPAEAWQKMTWLAGEWRGTDAGQVLQQSFEMYSDKHLMLHQLLGGKTSIQGFVWKNGHYFFGQNQQWIVTWIGEKDIRFDSTRPHVSPMTWTRINAETWHLIRHNPQGDHTVVMERNPKTPS